MAYKIQQYACIGICYTPIYLFFLAGCNMSKREPTVAAGSHVWNLNYTYQNETGISKEQVGSCEWPDT